MEDKPNKIYGSDIDEKTLCQYYDAFEKPFVLAGALMPDAHLGTDVPIGSVLKTDKVVVPSWVGVDIGCGVSALKTSLKKEQVDRNKYRILNSIIEKIPVGFKNRIDPFKWYLPFEGKDSPTDVGKKIFDLKQGQKQLATLGGGNHFIEIGYGKEDEVWIIVHTGSRGTGYNVARYYMKRAKNFSKDGAFEVDSLQGKAYLKDYNFCKQYAKTNRHTILHVVQTLLHRQFKNVCAWSSIIDCVHNNSIPSM